MTNFREIKFRAWAPEDGCMYDFEAIKDWPIELLNSDKNWKYMQYTGLKDKNGVEIYEGDIFDCIYKFDGCPHKMVVCWVDRSARFGLKGYGNCYQPNVEKSMGDLERKKIIGNIYENPELLNNLFK